MGASRSSLSKVLSNAVIILVTIALYGIPSKSDSSDNVFDSNLLNVTKGLHYYKPSDFFKGDIHLDQAPELGTINTQNNEMIQRLTWYLESEGLSVGIGYNPNKTSFFNLYDPSSFNFSLIIPPINYGRDDSTLAGRLNFLTHDPVHMYLGMAYIPVSDVMGPAGKFNDQKIADARQAMMKMLLQNEAAATAFTFAYHMKWYWNWLHAQKNFGDKEYFDDLNKGLASFGRFEAGDYYDLMDAHVNGRILDHAKLLKAKIDFDFYSQARQAGVPMMFPDLSKFLTPLGEKLFFNNGFSTLLSVVTYYDSKGGYKKLRDFAKIQANFYTSDWYLEWANLFQIGQPLADQQRNFQTKIADLRAGRFLQNVEKPKEGVFEVMQVRNAMTQFGRKLVELKYFGLQHSELFTSQDQEALETLIQSTASFSKYLYQRAHSSNDISEKEYMAFFRSARNQMKAADVRFPVSRYIPMKVRLGHADYSNFWFDPSAVVLPRPDEMVNYPSNKSVWEEALDQRIQRAKAEASEITYAVPRIDDPKNMEDLVAQLAIDYNEERKGEPLVQARREGADYLAKIETFRLAIAAQVEKVFTPQILEFSK